MSDKNSKLTIGDIFPEHLLDGWVTVKDFMGDTEVPDPEDGVGESVPEIGVVEYEWYNKGVIGFFVDVVRDTAKVIAVFYIILFILGTMFFGAGWMGYLGYW